MAREVLCVQPTGAGKSMCFQAAAAVLEGCTLIVSPLLSLMFDQVESMGDSGVRAATLNSMLSSAEREEVMRSLAAGELDLLYTSPEQLDKNQKLIAILARSTPSLNPSSSSPIFAYSARASSILRSGWRPCST